MLLDAPSASHAATTAPPSNAAALAALGLDAASGSAGNARVAIGFVDYGFDLLHPCLKDAHGTRSRFRYLWDQNRTPRVDVTANLDLATLEDWDGALLDDEVAAATLSGSRRALDLLYDPHANCCGRRGTVGGAHGTLMASMAAGTPFAGFRGAAPSAELIGVQLALPDHDWKEVDERGQPRWLDWTPARAPSWNGWRAYDAAPQILSAIHYVYDRACRLGVDALVINLSIGAWAGAHDGASPVERGIATLVHRANRAASAGRGPRTIVVAGAGNAGTDDGHWMGDVTRAAPQSFDWIMQRRDPTQNKLEIWYEGAATPLDITLQIPGRGALGLAPGRTHELVAAGTRIGVADHECAVRGGLSCVRILLHPPLFPAGLFDGAADTCGFTLGLSNNRQEVVRLHAWVERDDGVVERSWLTPAHAQSSLCCLATAPGVITVAGFDHQAGGAVPGIMPASSLGPAPWATGAAARLPHFAAPAHGIWGACSKSRGFCQTTGTSAAVALTSGAIAAYLAAAGAAAPLPTAGGPWSPRFGHGPFRIDRIAVTGEAA